MKSPVVQPIRQRRVLIAERDQVWRQVQKERVVGEGGCRCRCGLLGWVVVVDWFLMLFGRGIYVVVFHRLGLGLR